MSVDASKLKKIIELTIQKELRNILPEMVREVMANLIMESRAPQIPLMGNSHKRVNLQNQLVNEASGGREDFEEYPTATATRTFDRGDFASKMGYDSFDKIGNGFRAPGNATVSAPAHRGLITVDRLTGDAEGQDARPIDPNSIPDHLLQVFNRDYSGIVKAWDKK